MNEKTIKIQNFEELMTKMNKMEFWVDWKVTSAFGPDWIGSQRTIDFYLDEYELSETKFCKELKKQLINLLSIPKESEHHCIYGHGDITLKENRLEIFYDWRAEIPYDNPSEQKEGKLFFYP